MTATVAKIVLSGAFLLAPSATEFGAPVTGAPAAAVALIPPPTAMVATPHLGLTADLGQQFDRSRHAAKAGQPGQPVQLASLDTDSLQVGFRPPILTPPPTEIHCGATQTYTEPVLARKHFRVGDKVKVTFYEQIDNAERDKWGKGGSNGKNIQQFVELTGEYNVQEDETIVIPALGAFAAGNKSPEELKTTLAGAFSDLFGRKAYVTVMLLERPPIYVLGPVKTPGSYKFQAGMTVLHAVAMAGGYEKLEPGQKIDVVREQTRRYGGLEAISDLLARVAVLKGERDRVAPVPPPRLVDLVGDTKAKTMIAAEIEKRTAIVKARSDQESALAQQIEFARSEVRQLANRLRPADEMLKLRTDRANAVKELAARGVAARITATNAQAEVLEADSRRSEVVNQISQSQQRLAQLEQEQAKLVAHTRAELENNIQAIEQQITFTSRDTEVSAGILGALKVNLERSPQQTTDYAYEVVRQTPKGPVVLPSTGMTVLSPGDLVRVVSSDDPEGQQNSRGTPKVRPQDPSQTGIKAINDCK